MSPKKCFVCGTVRNCETYIDGVFENIERIRSLFSDIRIILSYDVSQDLTLRKLISYKSKYPNYDIHINRSPLSPHRTENIANARNAILDKMRECTDAKEEWTHFIMLDFDDVCAEPLDIEVLKDALCLEGWDAISFHRPKYYDLWALSLDPFYYSCWGLQDPRAIVEMMRTYIHEKLDNLPKDQVLECDSAFNGFAIYRCDPFLKCHYDWHIPAKYISRTKMQRNLVAVQGRAPIGETPDCEHRHFHMQAKYDYGAKIGIVPRHLFRHWVTSH